MANENRQKADSETREATGYVAVDSKIGQAKVGMIELDTIHYDHHNAATMAIKIYDKNHPKNAKNEYGWGYKIWDGTLTELIADINAIAQYKSTITDMQKTIEELNGLIQGLDARIRNAGNAKKEEQENNEEEVTS